MIGKVTLVGVMKGIEDVVTPKADEEETSAALFEGKQEAVKETSKFDLLC